MATENFTIFTILGATGDLVDKKIIPALYSLFSKKLINSDSIKIIAFARRNFLNGKYKEIIDHSLSLYAKINLDKVDLTEFYKLFDYHQGQFDSRVDFVSLAEKINNYQDKKLLCAHKIFYLAIPTHLYAEVISNINSTQLQDMCSGSKNIYSQVIIEKPFGKNLKTSLELDDKLKELFREDQIYRIDHYLGKDIIFKIIQFRQNNFQKFWNKNHIKSITISTVEDLNIDKRGAFYDDVGALVDVGQNHLLELLAILTMDITKKDYQAQRATLLSKLKIFEEDEIQKYTFRAQYEGYRQVVNVRSDSHVETYFKVASFLQDEAWDRVPFFLESGKRCGVTKKEIIVNFKDGQQIVFDFVSNSKIIINNQEVSVSDPNIEVVQYVGEYAKLFYEALNRQRDNFVSIEEIASAWKYIDPIRQAWDRGLVPLDSYPPDDAGVLDRATLKVVNKL